MTDQASDELARITLAIPQGGLRERLSALFEERGIDVRVVDPPQGRLEGVTRLDADVLVVRRGDLKSQGAALDDLAQDGSSPDVVVIGEELDPLDRTQLVADGAAEAIDADRLDAGVVEVIETLATGGGHLQPDTGGLDTEPTLSDFASHSPAMQSFIDLVRRVADTPSTLLVTGETGVGKEHLARAIHRTSGRREGPFIAVNCGALPEQLLESELFGHEKGAFTGAATSRQGCFEQATGGTILLDEIGEMPAHLQVKLLSVLQRGEIRPLGSEASARVDVRVIAATNRDLSADVEEGRFREDLYYRINVITLPIPPLRERKEDLPTLIGSLLRHYRARTGRTDVRGIEPAALEALLDHAWPGNVRELINVLERATLITEGSRIRKRDLPPELGGAGGSPDAEALLPQGLPPAWVDRSWSDVRTAATQEVERAYLVALLRRHEGRVGETARAAGLSPRSLYDKMKRHALDKDDFR